jgi:hypothetical protein
VVGTRRRLVDLRTEAGDLRLALRRTFRFGAAFDLGFDLLALGMTCPSCCALIADDETRHKSIANDQIVICLN